MKKKVLGSLLVGALFCQSAMAMDLSTKPIVDKAYLTVGLQGIGVGLGKSISEKTGFRVDFNGGSLEDDFEETGTKYRGELDLQSFGGYVDYFPFSGAFRMTAGLAYFGSSLSLNASGAGQTADIGGQTVVFGANDSIEASVDWPSVAPYVGIGFGHGKSTKSGFYASADFGFYIGDFKSDLTVSPSLRAQLGPTADADIEREREDLKDSVGDLGFVPSLQLYVGYRF